MGTAKRVYLYIVSAISLLVLCVGLYDLVAYSLGGLADAFGATVLGGGTGREQVSLAIALVIVGLPVFALHWRLVGRGWRGTDAAALEDRRAPLRALHLGLVATVALAFGTFAALQIVGDALLTVFGVDRVGNEGRLTDEFAMLIITLPIWWYHVRRRNADLRHDELVEAAAWLTRLYRYGWAFAGLMLLASGVSAVIETLALVLVGRTGFGAADRWWLGPLAWSISSIVVGLGVFWFHADDARRAIRDTAIIGEDDRASAVRAAYFGAVILVALSYLGVTVASSLAGLGRWALGLTDASGIADFLELVVGPVLVAIPFALAGWVHWIAQRREAAGRSPIALATAERLALHLAAGVGLAFLAVGAGQLLGRFVEAALGVAVVDDLFRRELAWFAAQIVVGAALWIPAWAMIMQRRAADPSTERRATIGRAYLYLVVGVSLLAAVPSAVFTLYRLIDTLLGGRGSALGSDLAIPIAVVIVASVVAAYHGRLVVADLRLAGETERAIEAETAALASVPAPSAIAASITLTLRGPAGTDFQAVTDRLCEHLPDGMVLERSVIETVGPKADAPRKPTLRGRPRPI